MKRILSVLLLVVLSATLVPAETDVANVSGTATKQ
jgi:hypothetical protein